MQNTLQMCSIGICIALHGHFAVEFAWAREWRQRTRGGRVLCYASDAGEVLRRHSPHAARCGLCSILFKRTDRLYIGCRRFLQNRISWLDITCAHLFKVLLFSILSVFRGPYLAVPRATPENGSILGGFMPLGDHTGQRSERGCPGNIFRSSLAVSSVCRQAWSSSPTWPTRWTSTRVLPPLPLPAHPAGGEAVLCCVPTRIATVGRWPAGATAQVGVGSAAPLADAFALAHKAPRNKS